MDPTKTQIVRDIESARAHLEKALDDLQELPVRDCAGAELAAHTLRSYVVLAKGTVNLLRQELAEYPVRDVHVWLDGLARGTDLMDQLVEQLQSGAVVRPELKWEEVEIATLMRRLCRLYQETAERRGMRIDFDAAVSTSRAWTDRIVAASVFQGILANAMRRSPDNSTVTVRVEELPEQIVSRIQDGGTTLRREENGRSPGNDDAAKEAEIGIAICRQSIEKLGGKLWCECEAGEGMRICVSLPKPRAAAV